MKRLLTLLLSAACWWAVACAQEPAAADSVTHPHKPGFFKRIINYITDEGRDSSEVIGNGYKPKWMILGGPHYSNDSKLGLALMGVLSFRLKSCPLSDPASTFNVWVDGTTAGFVTLGATGTMIFPEDRQRINLTLRFNYSPRKFWGIGYRMGDNNANESHMHEQELSLNADYSVRVAPHFYIGPALSYSHIHCSEIDRPELLDGQPRKLNNFGLGVALNYDTRNHMQNATRGCYVMLKEMLRPTFFGNTYATHTTNVIARAYHPVWRGGVIAGEVQAEFNFGEAKWGMLAQLGNASSMRGYYNGRYRDKHSVSTQVELRQHVWKRAGFAVWAGVGNVFHNANTFGDLLPNGGIGYRLQLRKTVTLRLDYGFGKSGQQGFIMAVNEAF